MMYNKKVISLITESTLILFCFVLIAWSMTSGMIGGAVAVPCFGLVVMVSFRRIDANTEMTASIVVPVLLSAFQNVYLGFFAPSLSSTMVQILTILNFLYSCVIFIALFIHKSGEMKKEKLFNAFLLLVLYCIFSVALLNSINVVSIISSMRNIISVFLFFFIGVMVTEHLNIDNFYRLILLISLVVVLVGFFDVLSHGEMWRALNITDLWTKKGITVQASGLPTNFYSSETINGERIRRMASTFADPVNLGAFLFASFCIAWFKKRKVLVVLIILAIALTVSKGAFLGILIFACVYSYYNASKTTFYAMTIVAGFCGIAFLIIAMKTSANSVFLHISGLTVALKEMFRRPLGAGIGSNGVLARQFSGFSANEDITETGIGMIIGQLGVVGFTIYIYFFICIFKVVCKLENDREAIICLSLLLSVIANIFFNEVALSPNSCALYFMIIGYYSSKTWRQRGLIINEN